MSKLVQGVGVYEVGNFKSRVGKVQTREYNLWKSMLMRCYGRGFHATHPHYAGCTVSENFKNFQYFAEWCNNQIGFGKDDYHLDKDILYKGNRVYHEDLCVFVPSSLNNFYVRKNRSRGKSPIGVSSRGGKFRAYISVDAVHSHLGWFTTEAEAFDCYKSAKEKLAKDLAISLDGIVDMRVISSLQNFTVETTD